MAANALVQTRIDPAIKEQASEVLAAVGLTVSDAVRILLTRTAKEGALPFSVAASTKLEIQDLVSEPESKPRGLYLKNGIPVFDSGLPFPPEAVDFVTMDREERARELMGEWAEK